MTIRNILNAALAAWVTLVLIRFVGPEFDLPVILIDRLGLHVVMLGVCLALAAADAALSLCSGRDKEAPDV